MSIQYKTIEEINNMTLEEAREHLISIRVSNQKNNDENIEQQDNQIVSLIKKYKEEILLAEKVIENRKEKLKEILIELGFKEEQETPQEPKKTKNFLFKKK